MKSIVFFRIYLKADNPSSSYGKFELKVDNIRDVTIDANGEANVQKDNVAIKTSVNSIKLGLKNYNVDISSKDTDSGKRLEFRATNDGKNILSGRYVDFICRYLGN